MQMLMQMILMSGNDDYFDADADKTIVDDDADGDDTDDDADGDDTDDDVDGDDTDDDADDGVDGGFVCLFLLLYVPCQQLWSLRDGQFT